jgi:hypothetical protein
LSHSVTPLSAIANSSLLKVSSRATSSERTSEGSEDRFRGHPYVFRWARPRARILPVGFRSEIRGTSSVSAQEQRSRRAPEAKEHQAARLGQRGGEVLCGDCDQMPQRRSRWGKTAIVGSCQWDGVIQQVSCGLTDAARDARMCTLGTEPSCMWRLRNPVNEQSLR